MVANKTDPVEPRERLVMFPWANPLSNLNRAELAVSRLGRFDPISTVILAMVGECSYQIASSLAWMWKEQGLVHMSLTELSHDHANGFNLLWNDDVTLGLKYFDTNLRSFVAGVRETNIRVNYTSPLYMEDRPFKITLVDLEHVKEFKPDAVGYSYLARMMVEVFILSCLPGVARRQGAHPFPMDPRLGFLYFLDFDLGALRPIDSRVIGQHIKHGLSCGLIDQGITARPFSEAFDAAHWSLAVEDVADAIRTDVLRLSRIARIAERFVRVLQGIPEASGGGRDG